jgi:hypothetical protein
VRNLLFGRAHASRSQIAFVDCGRWEAFVQLAALVRRRGVVCVRVTTEASALKRRLTRLVFHHVVHVSDDGMRQWFASGAAQGMADIHLTEEAAAVLGATGATSGGSDWFHDKALMHEFLAGAGIPQPARVPVDAAEQEVGGAISFPVVVKEAVSYGGFGVRLARSDDGLRDALTSMNGDRGLLVQSYVEGPEFGYGCSARDGVVLQEATYRYVVDPTDPLSQATQLVTVTDARIAAVGRATIAALGGTGLFGLDLIGTGSGEFVVIDVNARPWGCFAALLALGLDFSAGYLAAVGLADAPPESPPVPAGEVLLSFPRAQQVGLVGDGMTRGNVGSYLGSLVHYAQAISVRYAVESAAFTALHLGRASRTGLTRRRRPRPGRRSRSS